MKKLTNYLFIALAAVSLMFTSCAEDGDALGPDITFKAGDGMITGDETVAQGDTITFSWEVNKGDANLDEFTIRLGALDVTGFPQTGIDKDQYEDTYSTILLDAGDYEFTFIATDKDGLQDIVKIVVTAEAAAGPIENYSVTIGSYNASEGSSFASVNGQVYLKADAISNSDKIDFMYFYGATNAATIASPADADAQSVFDWISGAGGFSTINDTEFGTTDLSTADFNAISNDAGIISEISSLSDSKVNQLSVGDVIVFKTASTSAHANKNGLALVTAITTGADGTIDLDVKVQQ